MRYVKAIAKSFALGTLILIAVVTVRILYPENQTSNSANNGSAVKPIPVQMGDRVLNIPRNYFFGPPEEGTFLLWAKWPGLIGPTPETRDEFWGESLSTGGYLLILAHDQSNTTDVAFRYNVQRKRWRQYDYTKSDAVHGLNVMKSTTGMGLGGKDTYVEGSMDEPSSFLTCGSKLNPRAKAFSCSHTFSNNGILYKITYPEPWLENWKEIQSDVVNLIDSFEITSNSTSLK